LRIEEDKQPIANWGKPVNHFGIIACVVIHGAAARAISNTCVGVDWCLPVIAVDLAWESADSTEKKNL